MLAAVATPDELLAGGRGEHWPALVTSARLLAEESPRDLAERQRPAHRDPDERREMRDLYCTLTWGAIGFEPVADVDSRA